MVWFFLLSEPPVKKTQSPQDTEQKGKYQILYTSTRQISYKKYIFTILVNIRLWLINLDYGFAYVSAHNEIITAVNTILNSSLSHLDCKNIFNFWLK